MPKPKLQRVLRLDSISLDKTYFTDEGYLIDCPIVTTTGIFEYKQADGSTLRELRLPEHVFDPASLESYVGKPVIITHEGGVIDKDNVVEEIIGTILSAGFQDGDSVRCKIIIHDTDLMKQSGLKELSLGYDQDDIEESGEYNGEPYDVVQTNIRINHLALVHVARAGPTARLNIDGKDASRTLKGVKSMPKKKQRTRNRNDGDLLSAVEQFQQRRDQRMADRQTDSEEHPVAPVPVPVPQVDTGAEDSENHDSCQCVRDNRDMRDDSGDPATVEEALVQIANMDEDIDTLLGIVDAIKADSTVDNQDNQDNQGNEDNDDEEDNDDSESAGNEDSSESQANSMNADGVDAIIRQRIQLGKMGDRIHLDGLEDLSPMEAKKRIIQKVKPSIRLDGKKRGYINAVFDVVSQEIKATTKDTNYQRSQMWHTDSSSEGRNHAVKSGASQARQRMLDKLGNGGE